MAIKLTNDEITTFKNNLEMLMPYQDHELLNDFAKGLYSSSHYNFELIKGLGSAIAINKVQMYSRHDVQKECQRLCAHLPFKDLYAPHSYQHSLDEVEFSLIPSRKALREQERVRKQEECERNDEILNHTIEPTLIDTSDFPEISKGLHITNSSDQAFAPEREAPPQVTIYGLSAGHVVEYITERYPTLEINVVILNPEVSAIMLSLDPQMGARLAKENVHLFLGDDDTPILPNRIILSPEIFVTPQVNSRLKQRLLYSMENEYEKLLARKREQELRNLILQYNYPNCLQAQQLSIKDLKTTCDIALIMPGASLTESIKRLKELKTQGVTLVACDTALPFLEQHSIVPDILVINDIGIYKLVGKNNALVEPQCELKSHAYDKTMVIYTPKAHLFLLSCFRGKKRIIYTHDMRRMRIPVQEGAFTDLDISLSVSSLMASLAIKMQAKKVYIFGMDNVSSQNESYYAGFSLEALPYVQSRRINTDIVMCNDGQERAALHQFTNYRIHFEDIVEQNQHIEFINCSPIGVIIKGCTLDMSVTANIEYENFNALI